MKDLLNFKKMLTPIIIPILFWIGTIICIIAGIVFIVLGVTGYSNPDNGEMVLLGIGYLVLGPIVIRVYCEFLIILFSINDTLTDIKKQLNHQEDQDDQTNS
jgi:uncharacterized membrane protein